MGIEGEERREAWVDVGREAAAEELFEAQGCLPWNFNMLELLSCSTIFTLVISVNLLQSPLQVSRSCELMYSK